MKIAAMRSEKGYKLSASDKTFTIVVFIILLLAVLVTAYPLLYVVSASVSDPNYVLSGKPIVLPHGFNLDGYKALFQDETIVGGFVNSILYTVPGTTLTVFLTILCGYALSRRDLKGRRGIEFFLMFTIIFDAGIIPNYLAIRDLKIIYTPWALILPGAINAWYIFIARTNFRENLPSDLLEAAKLDGCDDFRFLVQIAIPLSKAIIAVITLYAAVDYWGMFFYPLLYLNQPDMYPIQLVLRNILMQSNISMDMLTGLSGYDAAQIQLRSYSIKYALIVVSSLPLMIAYPFVQKYFVKGVMVGSIKG